MAKLLLAIAFLLFPIAVHCQDIGPQPQVNGAPFQIEPNNRENFDPPYFDPQKPVVPDEVNLNDSTLPKVQCQVPNLDASCAQVLTGFEGLLGKQFDPQNWTNPKYPKFIPDVSAYDTKQLLSLQQQILGLTLQEISDLPKKRTCPECVTDPEQDANDFVASNSLANSLSMAKVSCQKYDLVCAASAEDAQNNAYDFTTYHNKPELDCNAMPNEQGGAPIKGAYSRVVGGQLHNCDKANFFSDPLCGIVDRKGFRSVVQLELSNPFSMDTCTGVVVDPNVILSAGHCFADKHSHEIQDDLVAIRSSQFGAKLSHVEAVKVVTSDAEVNVSEVIVHPNYSVRGSGEPVNDFAYLITSVPVNAEPIGLAADNWWVQDLTFAGYGISTQTDSKSKLRIGHARNVFSNGEQIDVTSAFSGSKYCNGDSGGPVFSGIQIGCPAGTRWADSNPRLLQGLISSFTRGPGPNLFDKCKNSPKFRIEKLDKAKIATWICPQLPQLTFCK
jgi:V8-like Glu-specific endopeptidase